MKKILILSFMLTVTFSWVHAQKNKIQTAWNYLKYEELDKAKTAIDEASVHEVTIGMAKTWYYKGLIYQKMYKHEKYGNLDPDPLHVALESYNKALQIEPDYEYKQEINQRKQMLANQYFSLGVEYFNAKDYMKSEKAFESVLMVSPNDTMATLNAAYSADRSDNKAKAREYYQKLISMNYKEPKIYSYLANVFKSEGDTAKALTIIKEGRQKFPADNYLVIDELNVYLSTDRDKEAEEMIDLAIEGDPENAALYFVKGTVKDKTGKQEEAATAYKKAIELKPDYFDPYYNLGAMYFNAGAEMANKANEIKSNDEYAKAKVKFEAKFKEAMPFLEKAIELNPDDTNTLVSLKQLYARLGENEKYEMIKAKLEGK